MLLGRARRVLLLAFLASCSPSVHVELPAVPVGRGLILAVEDLENLTAPIDLRALAAPARFDTLARAHPLRMTVLILAGSLEEAHLSAGTLLRAPSPDETLAELPAGQLLQRSIDPEPARASGRRSPRSPGRRWRGSRCLGRGPSPPRVRSSP